MNHFNLRKITKLSGINEANLKYSQETSSDYINIVTIDKWVLGLPLQKTIKYSADGKSDVFDSVSYEYYPQNSDFWGFLHFERTQPQRFNSLTNAFEYDRFGNIASNTLIGKTADGEQQRKLENYWDHDTQVQKGRFKTKTIKQNEIDQFNLVSTNHYSDTTGVLDWTINELVPFLVEIRLV